LLKIRKRGFAVTQGLAETGIVAIGVPVRNMAGEAIAGLSMSLPSVRFDPARVPGWVAKLASSAAAIEADISGKPEIGP
jgi:DNA-binding IclR family transcriptional regulator